MTYEDAIALLQKIEAQLQGIKQALKTIHEDAQCKCPPVLVHPHQCSCGKCSCGKCACPTKKIIYGPAQLPNGVWAVGGPHMVSTTYNVTDNHTVSINEHTIARRMA